MPCALRSVLQHTKHRQDTTPPPPPHTAHYKWRTGASTGHRPRATHLVVHHRIDGAEHAIEQRPLEPNARNERREVSRQAEAGLGGDHVTVLVRRRELRLDQLAGVDAEREIVHGQ